MWFHLRHAHGLQAIRRNVLAGATHLLGVFRSDWFSSSRWNDFQDLLWPPHCAACGKFLCEELESAGHRLEADGASAGGSMRIDLFPPIEPRSQMQGGQADCQESWHPAAITGCLLCRVCLMQFTRDTAQACGRCGAPVGPYAVAGRKIIASRSKSPVDLPVACGRCRSESWLTNGVMRVGVYRRELRRACLSCKQSAGGELTRALGEVLFATHLHDWASLAIDGVVPVPQHWTSRLISAEHPATVLARCLARRLQVPCWDRRLWRVRRGRRQRRLNADERRANVCGSFRVRHGAALSGLRLLLVDDILTTGATVNEICRVLRRAGVARVYVAVLARGLPARSSWKVGTAGDSGGRSTGIPTAGPADLSATDVP